MVLSSNVRLSIPDAKGANKFSKANNKLMDYQKLKFKDAVAAFIIWGNKFSDMIKSGFELDFRFVPLTIPVFYVAQYMPPIEPCWMEEDEVGFTKNRSYPPTSL